MKKSLAKTFKICYNNRKFIQKMKKSDFKLAKPEKTGKENEKIRPVTEK